MKQTHSNGARKKKHIVRAVLLALALVLLLPIGVSCYVVASSADQIITLDEAANCNADAILVLGARVWDNGNPSGILEDRLITGIDAYQAGASDRLLMSGDHGRDDYDEVGAMKDYALDQGIPSEAVFMDHAGFSTYESLYRARDIFQVKTVVIVTQRYHLFRALYIARQLGLNAYGVAADLRTYPGMPRFEARAILARTKDFIYTIFLPQPTYLGDVIPIPGDGNLTNG